MSAMLDSVVHLIKGLLITDKQSESEFTTYALASGMSHDTFEWEFKGKAYNITILHEAHTMLSSFMIKKHLMRWLKMLLNTI